MTNSRVKNMGWFKRQKKEESTETVTEIESQGDAITPEEPQQEAPTAIQHDHNGQEHVPRAERKTIKSTNFVISKPNKRLIDCHTISPLE